jgi:hypothetical protein
MRDAIWNRSNFSDGLNVFVSADIQQKSMQAIGTARCPQRLEPPYGTLNTLHEGIVTPPALNCSSIFWSSRLIEHSMKPIQLFENTRLFDFMMTS